MIENRESDRIFARDHLIEHGARGDVRVDDVLFRETLEPRHAGVVAHLAQHGADEAWATGAARRAPRHLALPFDVEQIVELFRRAGGRHERGVVTGREEIKVRRDPETVGVLQFGWILIGVRADVGGDESRLRDRRLGFDAIEYIGARLSRLALVDDLQRGRDRVRPVELHVDARIFPREGVDERTHRLIDDERRVPDDLPLGLGRGVKGGFIGARARGQRKQERAGKGKASLHRNNSRAMAAHLPVSGSTKSGRNQVALKPPSSGRRPFFIAGAFGMAGR